MKKIVLVLFMLVPFLSLQAQDHNFSTEYNKLLWPTALGFGGGLTGDDGNYKRLTLFHGHSIALQTGSNLPNHGLTRLYISGSGNVGVGTTTPLGAFDVRGRQLLLGTIPTSIGHSANEYPSVGYNILFTSQSNTYTYRVRDYASFIHFDVGGFRFKTAAIGDAGAQIDYQERMTIGADGNVGIGTTTPDARLTVAGNVHAREVKVTVSAGADFVFEPNYALPSLEDTEAFVREHKHLPGIAPAQEMKEDGIELSRMNILLLQKVEELTLHLIELEKKVKYLQEQQETK